MFDNLIGAAKSAVRVVAKSAVSAYADYKNIAEENTESSYCVYMHTHKKNHKKYIGITSQPPNNRWRKGEGYRECPYFYNAIQRYGWDAFQHEVLFTGLTLREAEQKEVELIAEHKSNMKKYGYNISSGGNSTGKMSEETKKKISKTLKGRQFTEEHRRKKSEAQMGEKNHRYGKHHTKEQIERIRKANIEHPSRGCFPSRKVNQYDLQGNLIKTWNNMGEIKRELGLNHCGISDCCRGRQHTAGGYIWRYYQ